MIRRCCHDGLLLVTQNDHAAVAAQIAEHWGNTRFPTPEPHAAVIEAINCHDAGWSLHDDKPTLNQRKIPAAFYEMPIEWYVRVWVASISVAAAQGGPMAGLIVSWHFTALAESAAITEQSEPVQNLLGNFKSAQHGRRLEYTQDLGLSASLAENAPLPVTDSDRAAVYNLCVLRACDWISLLMCANELPDMLMPAPTDLEAWLHAPVRAIQDNGGPLCLDPWPLDVPELTVDIDGRRIPNGKYGRGSDLLRVYEQSEVEKIRLTLAGKS